MVCMDAASLDASAVLGFDVLDPWLSSAVLNSDGEDREFMSRISYLCLEALSAGQYSPTSSSGYI